MRMKAIVQSDARWRSTEPTRSSNQPKKMSGEITASNASAEKATQVAA
jgi:hypothetical protein